MKTANEMDVGGTVINTLMRYSSLGDGKRADACIGCGQCRKACPQKIDVPAQMTRLADMVAKQKSWEEICRRYDAIKDHKPRASKKLKELGEILASAYTFSPQKADEMWQYIIELNISDNIEFSKFYIAQVFNKLTDFMPSEDAVSLAMMQPERIRLMLLYGYSGGTAHHVIYTIIGFLVQQNRFDEAIEIVDMLQDKSAQDYEQEKEPLQYFGNLATSLRQSNEEKESSLPEFYFRYAIKKESLDNFFSVCEMTYPDSEVWAISYASRMLEGTELANKELLEKCLWRA